MAVELVTGYSGSEHVSSSDDGARQAGTVGTGMYVLETVEDPLAATLENANTVTIGPGDALVNGRHVRLTGSTTFAVPVGTQGMQTSNLLVLRYSVSDDGTEKAEAVTLTGDPAASDPQDPALATGSILDGDSPVDMALYRVVTTGIESAQPVRLFSTVPPIAMLSFADLAGSATSDQLPVVPVSKGGTGAASAAAARSNLGVPSLGSTAENASVYSDNRYDQRIIVRVEDEDGGNFGLIAKDDQIQFYDFAKQKTVWRQGFGSSGFLPVSQGGTGATSGAAALESLGIKSWLLSNVFRIGFVWVSYTNTSPASIVGGTWTAITGRFPYFNAGVGTGGSNSHTHGLTNGFAKFFMGQETANHYSFLSLTKTASWSGNGKLLKLVDGQDDWWNMAQGNISTHTTGMGLGGTTDSGNNMPLYQTLYAWRRTA